MVHATCITKAASQSRRIDPSPGMTVFNISLLRISAWEVAGLPEAPTEAMSAAPVPVVSLALYGAKRQASVPLRELFPDCVREQAPLPVCPLFSVYRFYR